MSFNIIFSKLKKGVIYYFSGTGNTFYIVNKYVELFEKKNIDVDVIDITSKDSIGSQSKYDFICFAYPTYALHPPFIVTKFIKKFPNVRNKPCFIIASAAEMHGDALGISARILKNKNYNVLATFKYFLPHNACFVFKKQSPTDKKIKSMIDNTNLRIKKDFENLIIGNNVNIEYRNLFLISLITSWFFNTFIIKLKKKHWMVDLNKCNQCGICERICPNNNIVIKHKKRKIIFGDECLFCGRCYNLCPQNAIYYKNNKTKKNYGSYTIFKNYFLKK